jgi:hypothetical protein
MYVYICVYTTVRNPRVYRRPNRGDKQSKDRLENNGLCFVATHLRQCHPSRRRGIFTHYRGQDKAPTRTHELRQQPSDYWARAIFDRCQLIRASGHSVIHPVAIVGTHPHLIEQPKSITSVVINHQSLLYIHHAPHLLLLSLYPSSVIVHCR